MTTKKTTETPKTELKDTMAGILKKPATRLKSPSKMPSMREQRKRWKLVGGMMIEMGSDDDAE